MKRSEFVRSWSEFVTSDDVISCDIRWCHFLWHYCFWTMMRGHHWRLLLHTIWQRDLLLLQRDLFLLQRDLHLSQTLSTHNLTESQIVCRKFIRWSLISCDIIAFETMKRGHHWRLLLHTIWQRDLLLLQRDLFLLQRDLHLSQRLSTHNLTERPRRNF